MKTKDKWISRDQSSPYRSIAGIKVEFGLTDAMIEKLGEPDDIVDNPKFKSAEPMKLYLKTRVEAFIKDLKEHHPSEYDRMLLRKKRALRAVLKKQRNMEVQTKKIIAGLQFKDYNASEIPRLTTQQHFAWIFDRHGFVDDDEPWEPSFNAQINYIRHNLTNYESILDSIKGKVGVEKAYETIKAALNARIIEQYKAKLVESGDAEQLFLAENETRG